VTEGARLGLLQGFGIEIEYMIVDAVSLDVASVADELITRAAGSLSNEIERGDACWSNELVAHVIEFKSNGRDERRHGRRGDRCAHDVLPIAHEGAFCHDWLHVSHHIEPIR
jgi:hypothetical protein